MDALAWEELLQVPIAASHESEFLVLQILRYEPLVEIPEHNFQRGLIFNHILSAKKEMAISDRP